MRSFSKRILAFVFVALLLVMPKVRGWNDASRMATVQSLVEKQTFVIDKSVFVNTNDKVYINEHYYSDKPTIPSIMGAIIYLPLFHLGIKLDYGWNFAYYLITLFTVKVFWLMGLSAFYSALEFCNIKDRNRLWLTFALGIASLHFTWSSTFNNHSLAASQLIIGFYLLLKSRQSVSVKRNLFYAGFFISLAGTVDAPTAAFYVGFLFYILINSNLRRQTLFYLIPLMLTVLPALSVNYYISGSVIPVQINRNAFEYPGSPWVSSDGLSGVKANQGIFFLVYSFSSLLGPKGFLLYNPLLFIALPYLIREIRKGQPFRQEALVISLVSLIFVFYYFLFTDSYGGWSYSIRWFVPLLPLLFFFIHPFFENFNLKRRRIFTTLFSIATIISCIGIINPWSNGSLSEIPLVSNIKALIAYFLNIMNV
jgi:hypothetical protein